MSLELDRLTHRRDPVARETVTRTGAERARERAATALQPALEEERPATPGFEADPDGDLAAETGSDAGIRLSLSAAALGIERTGDGREAVGGRAATSDDATGPDEDTSRPEAGRRRVFDAYRDAAPTPRGERIRVVV